MTDLRRLAEAATPGPWYDQTVGHRSIRHAAGAVTRALFMAPFPSCTDLSWVYSDEPNICLTGNGPTSVENAAYIAACSPEVILALLDVVDAARGAQVAALYLDERTTFPILDAALARLDEVTR